MRRATAMALLVLASAALYATAFPPLALRPLAWCALVPLLVALARVRPAAGAALGLLFGVVAAAAVAPWLPAGIRDYFGVGTPWAWAAALGVFVASAGLHFSAFGAAISWLARRGALGPLAVAAAWGAVEWTRASGPLANPWALVAYSQPPGAALVQTADLAGPFGLGMLIAAVNAVLAGLWLAPREPRAFALRAATVGALVAAAFGYGSWRLAQPILTGPAVDAVLVQGAIERERRFRPDSRADNLERHLALTRTPAARTADLVLWPELAVDFPPSAEHALGSRLAQASRGTELLVGAPGIRHRQLVAESYNSAFLFRDGRLADRYDKVRLLPFSEARPLPRWFALGRDHYRPGSEQRAVETRAGALGVLLCSEAMHPGHVRRLVESGADLLSNPSNDDWFASRAAARQQLEAVSFRAIENRRWILRPAMSGFTAAIDPWGRVAAEAPFGAPHALRARATQSSAETPYQRWGDVTPAMAGVLASFFGVRSARARGAAHRR